MSLSELDKKKLYDLLINVGFEGFDPRPNLDLFNSLKPSNKLDPEIEKLLNNNLHKDKPINNSTNNKTSSNKLDPEIEELLNSQYKKKDIN